VVKAGVDPLSTSGSQRNGGRYNDPGVGVLYTSFDRATAVAEIVRGLRVRGIDPKNFGPEDWWVYQIRVSVSSVVDLRDGATMSDLAITPEVLLADNTTETRRIGKYARDNGFQAVRAPSAAANDKDNLVLFIDRLPTRPEVVSSTPVDLSPGT
jgi:RES domain-containing protein